MKLYAALQSITSKCGQYIWSTPVAKSVNLGARSIDDMSFFHTSAQICCLSGYFLAKAQQPIPTCSEDEEVTMPVQEAGNVTKIKMDPWPGLQRGTFDLSHGRLEARVHTGGGSNNGLQKTCRKSALEKNSSIKTHKRDWKMWHGRRELPCMRLELCAWHHYWFVSDHFWCYRAETVEKEGWSKCWWIWLHFQCLCRYCK